MTKLPPHEKALSFLRAHNVMTMATVGPQGPWSAALFYVNDRFTLYFLSSPQSRHIINLSHDSRVSATIQEDCRSWRKIKGIQLEGRASSIAGTEQLAALRSYGLKFPIIADLAGAPTEIVVAMDRIAWYKIVPARLFSIDNSLGLGHREEVRLDESQKTGDATSYFPRNLTGNR